MRVLIGGPPYGCKNIGDEAILSSIIYSLRKIEKGIGKKINITVLTADLKNTEKRFGVSTTEAHGKFNLMREIIRTDVLICGGATILSDCPRYALKLVKYAHLMGKKVIIYGVGMNSINDPDMKRFIRDNSNKANVITVRDKDVKSRLLEYGVTVPVFATADPAVLIEPAKKERVNEILSINNIPYEASIVGFGISGEEDVRHITPVEEFAKAIDFLIEQYGMYVLFIPTNFREDQDIPLMQAVLKQMKIPEGAQILNEFMLPEDLIGLVSRTKLIISSRLHLLIFGVNAGVPVIGVSRGEKVTSFVSYLGEKPISSVEEFTLDRAKPYFERYINHNQEYKKIIENAHLKMYERAKQNEDILKVLLEGEIKDYLKLHI